MEAINNSSGQSLITVKCGAYEIMQAIMTWYLVDSVAVNSETALVQHKQTYTDVLQNKW